MKDEEEIVVLKVPVIESSMSSMFLTILMAMNVVLAYVALSTTVSWFSCGLVVVIALWQWRAYRLEQAKAELRTTIAVLMAVMSDQYDRLQALMSDGTNDDETCLSQQDQRTEEVQEND